jgi:hypothetical protein
VSEHTGLGGISDAAAGLFPSPLSVARGADANKAADARRLQMPRLILTLSDLQIEQTWQRLANSRALSGRGSRANRGGGGVGVGR